MYQKLQVGRGLNIAPSDTIDIPNPAAQALSGTSTGTAVDNKLVDDTNEPFETSGVSVGDIVYNTSVALVPTVATITAIDNGRQLSLSANIFPASGGNGKTYRIFRANENDGCVLYVGAGAEMRVLTAGGDVVNLNAVPNGSYVPIQVKRVYATTDGSTATDAAAIVALW